MLNLSLDEVLEFVSLGYLPPVTGTEARDYRFRLREIRIFAERFLGYQAQDFDSAVQRVEVRTPAPQSPSVVDATQLVRGGIIDFTAHEERVTRLGEEKDALFTQYARYREQVGYRIGQLETLLQQEQQQRTTVQQRAQEQEEKLDLLKKKLLDARKQLEDLEHAKAHQWWARLRAMLHSA